MKKATRIMNNDTLKRERVRANFCTLHTLTHTQSKKRKSSFIILIFDGFAAPAYGCSGHAHPKMWRGKEIARFWKTLHPSGRSGEVLLYVSRS